MKKIFIFSIAVIALFASCKKNSPATPAGISATINGTSKNFNELPSATKSYLGGVDQIQILGGIASGETIGISISNDLGGGVDSIVAGTYSDTSTRFSIELDYLALVGPSFITYSGGTFIDGSEGPGTQVTNHLVINITSITSNSIKGTFSGNVYLNGDPTAGAWAVTNASFNLAMKQQ